MTKIMISGGGTGGHIFPAIAIANALKKIEPQADILFIGAQDKMEMEKVPQAGYPIKGLWISGFHRKLTLRNLLFPLKLISSLIKAHYLIGQFKPDVVVGVGGFASGPMLKIATWKGIPTLIQEQNSYPGITNRLLANHVNRVCASYEEVKRFFPAEKVIITGNPVREDIINKNISQEAARKHFGLDPQKKTIFVFGGSLGAQSINQAMRANAALLKANSNIQVLWQIGKLYIEAYTSCETAQLPNVKISQFIDRMDIAYQMADLIIARAGALTISELCLVAKPAILIPSPNVAEDHQTKNAMALVERQAAIILHDQEAEDKIIKTALEVLEDQALQEKLSMQIKSLAKVNAAQKIAQEVLKLV